MTFTVLFIYVEVLKARLDDYCDNTGTTVGILSTVPIYILGLICTIAAGLGAILFLYIVSTPLHAYLRRNCCCCGGTKFIGKSLAKITY